MDGSRQHRVDSARQRVLRLVLPARRLVRGVPWDLQLAARRRALVLRSHEGLAPDDRVAHRPDHRVQSPVPRRPWNTKGGIAHDARLSQLNDEYVLDAGYTPLSPIPDIAKINKREAVAKNYADNITRIEGLGMQLARQFVKLEELAEQMLEVGIRTEPVLAPHVHAALTAWQAGKVDEPPMARPLA